MNCLNAMFAAFALLSRVDSLRLKELAASQATSAGKMMPRRQETDAASHSTENKHNYPTESEYQNIPAKP